jgi:DNA replication protein DnaC
MKTTTSVRGGIYPSTLYSYLASYKSTYGFQSTERLTGKRFPYTHELLAATSGTSTCPFCAKVHDKLINDERYGLVYCLCQVLELINDTGNILNAIRSKVSPVSLEELKAWGLPDERKSLHEAVSAAKNFIDDPSRWLVLSGNTGSGKTHMLMSIANTFGPYALYITAGDFERIAFQSLRNGVFDQFIDLLENAPFLLFDDWGSEHGKDFVASKFRAVIDYRYARWPQLPVAITTNRGAASMIDYDDRVASRFMERDKVNIVQMTVKDHRERGAA